MGTYILWIIEKAREFQKNTYFHFTDYINTFDCVDHNKLWKILEEMGIPDHLTCLLRNLYAGQEATVRPGHGTMDWFQIGKGVRQGCIVSPCLFNLYAESTRRRRQHPTPVLWPGKSHGWRSLVSCSPWGRKELDTTEQLHFHFSLSCTGDGNGNPLQCSCLENPRDRGAWWAAAYGVAQSRTWLKRLSNSSREYIMRNARQDEAQAGIKIARRNINNLRHADDTILMAESKEGPKSLLMQVKEESEKAVLKHNIQKTTIIASVPSLHGK